MKKNLSLNILNTLFVFFSNKYTDTNYSDYSTGYWYRYQ